MNYEQVQQILKFYKLTEEQFAKFMIGQTMAMGDNGETIIFEDDIRRFLRWHGVIIKNNQGLLFEPQTNATQ